MKIQTKIIKENDKYYGHYFKGFNRIKVQLVISEQLIKKLVAYKKDAPFIFTGTFLSNNRFFVSSFTGAVRTKKKSVIKHKIPLEESPFNLCGHGRHSKKIGIGVKKKKFNEKLLD